MGKHTDPKGGTGRQGQATGKHSVSYTRDGYPVAKPGQHSVTEIILRLVRGRKS